MKRYTAEISLGLATACIITVMWDWLAHGHESGPHVGLVFWISMMVWFRSRIGVALQAFRKRKAGSALARQVECR